MPTAAAGAGRRGEHLIHPGSRVPAGGPLLGTGARPLQWLAWAALLLGLAGCEAPLRLEGVERNRAEALWRTDRLQAAARSGDSVVVVGNQGTIIHSHDRGQSWQRLRIPGWPELIDVTACPDGTFAALDPSGLVLVSTDEGRSWQGRQIETEEAVQDATCDPRGRLWVVGSFSSLFTSADGGETWALESTQEDVIYNNIQFVDEDVGYVTGEFGTILRTGDGGESWEPLPVLENDFYPQFMYFTDRDTGWLTGLGGTMLHTTDGGRSWSQERTQTQAPLYGLAAVSDELYAVGGAGVVLKRVGQEWKLVRHGKPIRLFLRAMQAVGEDRLLIGGREGALYILPVGDLPIGAKS